MNSGDNIN